MCNRLHNTFAQDDDVSITRNTRNTNTPPVQPKTTTNNFLNPKNASNIHLSHIRYHIGFPHIGEFLLVTLVNIYC